MPSPRPPGRAIRAVFLATLTLGLLAASSLQAADTPKNAAKAKTPVMTREELRACMNAQNKLHQQRDETVQLQSQLAAEKESLARSGDALKEQLSTLDRTDKEAVEKYVALNNEREKRIDAFQANATAYNAKVDALQAEKDQYAKTCESRRFDEKDELAIRKGK